MWSRVAHALEYSKPTWHGVLIDEKLIWMHLTDHLITHVVWSMAHWLLAHGTTDGATVANSQCTMLHTP